MALSSFLYQSVLWKGLFYITAFILNIVIARHFKAETSGSVYYLISIFALVHLVLSLSLESGLTYFGAKRQISYGKLLSISLLWTLISLFILLLSIQFLRPGAQNSIDQKLFNNSIIFFVLGNLLSSYGSALFYSQNNFVTPNVVSLLVTISLILLVPYKGQSIFSLIDDSNYFYVYFFSYLIQGIIIISAFLLSSRETIRLELPRRIEYPRLLKFTMQAWLGNIIFFLVHRIDYWFVEKYCTTIELGNYIQVSKLAQLFFLVPSMFATAIFPLTAAGNRKAVIGWLGLTSRIFIFLYSIVCLFLVVTGYWLFPYVFGESFHYMHSIFILFVPGILSLSILYSITAYNGGNNRIWHNITGSLLALIFLLAGNMVLVPKYGVLAAAAVCSAAYILYQCYLLYQLKKTEHIKLSSFFIVHNEDLLKVKSLFRRN